MIVGVDEVGRGCLAGPVCVAAVALDVPIGGLTDSKLLTRNERVRLAKLIKKHAQAIGIGWVSHSFIDSHGLTAAQRVAAKQALSQLGVRPQEVLLDGKHNYIGAKNVRMIINGDLLEPRISAASIIAKVARDNYMAAMHQRFPGYGFAEHVGYATQQHQQALLQFGPCSLHRMTFATLRALSSVN